MATHSSVLAWRIPGTAESGGLLSMESHRVGHDWSDLAAAAAAEVSLPWLMNYLGVCCLISKYMGISHKSLFQIFILIIQWTDNILCITLILFNLLIFSQNMSYGTYTSAFHLWLCRSHQLWKILKEIGIPDHLTCLLRNLYTDQETTVRTLREKIGSKLGKQCDRLYIVTLLT